MRVLIVDGNPSCRDIMERHLRKVGLAVDVAVSEEEAAYLLAEHRYGCVVLDRGSGDRGGLGLLVGERRAGSTVPVMVVSKHRTTTDERVEALRAGADDCVDWPASPDEFESRVLNLCRRAGHTRASVLQVGDLTLDSARIRAQRAGRHLSLHAKEYSILELLMRRAGEVVPRRELWEQCWGERDETFSNTLEVHISRLRRAIGEPRMIQTVRGVGYSIDAIELPEQVDARCS